jgi:hypothetical protein
MIACCQYIRNIVKWTKVQRLKYFNTYLPYEWESIYWIMCLFLATITESFRNCLAVLNLPGKGKCYWMVGATRVGSKDLIQRTVEDSNAEKYSIYLLIKYLYRMNHFSSMKNSYQCKSCNPNKFPKSIH